MPEFIQTLSPLEKRGISTIEGFGKKIYEEANTEFQKINYKGRTRDVNVRDKLVRTIVALDNEQINTVRDLLDISTIETAVDVAEEERDLEITSEIIVSSILEQHESYSNTHKLVTNIESSHSEQELFKIIQICNSLILDV